MESGARKYGEKGKWSGYKRNGPTIANYRYPSLGFNGLIPTRLIRSGFSALSMTVLMSPDAVCVPSKGLVCPQFIFQFTGQAGPRPGHSIVVK